MKKIIRFIDKIAAEFLLIVGGTVALVTTYRVNEIIFYYLLALVFIISGYFVARTR